MIRRLSSIIISLFFATSVFGQVIVQFVPEISGRSVDGLFQCKLVNMSKTQNAVLTITVTERKKGTVCVIKTPSFTLIQGTNGVPPSAARNAAIQFPGNSFGQLTRINHQFAQGDYEYCFNVKLAQSDLPEEQCFSYVLAPFSELGLMEPANQEKICETRPIFSWQPLIPGIAGSYYQLVVAEIKQGQNGIEALNYNLPAINQSGIISPILPYPAVARVLEKGKRYAWQVTVYKDRTILNRSEIWSFTVDCGEEAKPVVADNGYRDIEDLSRGNYYIAAGVLKFALVNPYAPNDLKYEIVSLSNPDKKYGDYLRLNLRQGRTR